MRWIRNASTLTLSPRTGWRATVQHAQHSAGRATSARDGESRPAKRLSRYPGENRDRETRARHVTWGHYGVTRLRTALSARRDGPAHAPRVHRTARTRDTTRRERCELRRETIHHQYASDGGGHPGPALTRQSQCRTTPRDLSRTHRPATAPQEVWRDHALRRHSYPQNTSNHSLAGGLRRAG